MPVVCDASVHSSARTILHTKTFVILLVKVLITIMVLTGQFTFFKVPHHHSFTFHWENLHRIAAVYLVTAVHMQQKATGSDISYFDLSF